MGEIEEKLKVIEGKLHRQIRRVEFGVCRKERKVQDTDIDGGFQVIVVFAFIQVIKGAAEIAEGTFRLSFANFSILFSISCVLRHVLCFRLQTLLNSANPLIPKICQFRLQDVSEVSLTQTALICHYI